VPHVDKIFRHFLLVNTVTGTSRSMTALWQNGRQLQSPKVQSLGKISYYES
jgi:hypothetical protein